MAVHRVSEIELGYLLKKRGHLYLEPLRNFVIRGFLQILHDVSFQAAPCLDLN